MHLLEQFQGRAMETMRVLERLSYEERLKELWGDLIAIFQYLKGAYKKDGEQFFAQSDNSSLRGW